jgi:hypothetical protein
MALADGSDSKFANFEDGEWGSHARCSTSKKCMETVEKLEYPALQRKSHLCIPFLGIVRPQS